MFTSTNLRIRQAPFVDTDFNSVTLLLPLNGADAATSTTDESNENHTITFNAQAQLDTAQSKFGTASALFDGTGDYLSIPHDVSLQPLAVSFTVECHVRFNGDPTTDQHTFVSKWGGAGAKEWWVGYRNNELNAFLSSSGSNGIFVADVAWDPAGDTWYHIAFVFDRELATNETRVYVDGVQVGASDTTLNTYATFYDSSHDVWVGGYNADANDWMDGWIDNVRITKGVARYTSDFSPPSREYGTPSVDYTGTTRHRNLPQADPDFDSVVLLAPLSGEDGDTTSTDLSNSAHTLTFAGDTNLDSDIRKYGFTSAYFDGAGGDKITVPSSSDFAFGTDDFTIEFWARFSDITDINAIVWDGGYLNAIYCDANNKMAWYSDANLVQGSTFVVINEWTHVALVRASGTFELFTNGVSQGTNGAGRTFTASEMRIGSGDVNGMNGWMENVRITKGVARYTSAFTPPERAFPTVKDFGTYEEVVLADTPLVYFRCGEDDPGPLTSPTWQPALDTAGTTSSAVWAEGASNVVLFEQTSILPSGEGRSVSTDAVSWGGGAITDDNIYTPSGSFAIEGWVKLNGNPSTIANVLTKESSSFYPEWRLGVTSTRTVQFTIGSQNGATNSSDFATTTTLDIGTVYHLVAVYRTSDDTPRIFINGSEDTAGSTWNFSVYNSSADVGFAGQTSGRPTWRGDWNVQELAFYDHDLTDAQILAHYQAGGGT